MYKHILIPVDLSTASLAATRTAIAMAKSTRAKVTAVHVIAPFSPHAVGEIRSRGPAPLTATEYERVAQRRGEAVLEKVVAEAKAARVPCTVAIMYHEKPAEAIVDATRKYRCDAVVMATSGRKGIERFFVGSVASEVLRRSRVPVVVLR
ncbi:MAG TPA: universal stress protein [Usitatibacter sp.]|nr:universal stress protein [Usitatibacter sp.]